MTDLLCFVKMAGLHGSNMNLSLVVLLDARKVSASKYWRMCARILLVGLNMRLT